MSEDVAHSSSQRHNDGCGKLGGVGIDYYMYYMGKGL
jgi:hypothetical protein